MTTVRQCPDCDGEVYRPHCGSSMCFWLRCSMCGTVWDYASGRSIPRRPEKGTG